MRNLVKDKTRFLPFFPTIKVGELELAFPCFFLVFLSTDPTDKRIVTSPGPACIKFKSFILLIRCTSGMGHSKSY